MDIEINKRKGGYFEISGKHSFLFKERVKNSGAIWEPKDKVWIFSKDKRKKINRILASVKNKDVDTLKKRRLDFYKRNILGRCVYNNNQYYIGEFHDSTAQLLTMRGEYFFCVPQNKLRNIIQYTQTKTLKELQSFRKKRKSALNEDA